MNATAPVVLITGTSTGIGLETAVRSAKAGHTVVATMRDLGKADALRKAAADAGAEVDVRRLDVVDEDSITACLDGVADTYGRLDVLVNNAGWAATMPTIEMCPMAEYRSAFEANFFGVVGVTKHAMPHLRASRGRVITVGSTRGLVGQPFGEGYAASKFAAEGFMESLAPTAAAMGVTVVMVVPGPVVETAFAASSGYGRPELVAASGPYAPVLSTFLDGVAARGIPYAQTGAEVAEILVRTIGDPAPPFRIPASEWAAEYASLKYADLDGSAVQARARAWYAPEGDGP